MIDRDRFRFRVWSRLEKKYYYDIEQSCSFFSSNIPYDSWGELLEDDNYLVEQCTGIKDRCGKLIYEGDLVQKVVGGVVEKQGVVEWGNGNGISLGSWYVVDYTPILKCFADTHVLCYQWEIYGHLHEKEKFIDSFGKSYDNIKETEIRK